MAASGIRRAFRAITSNFGLVANVCVSIDRTSVSNQCDGCQNTLPTWARYWARQMGKRHVACLEWYREQILGDSEQERHGCWMVSTADVLLTKIRSRDEFEGPRSCLESIMGLEEASRLPTVWRRKVQLVGA